MKITGSVKISRDAIPALEELLTQIPGLKINRIEREAPPGPEHSWGLVDIAVDARFHGKHVSFWVEFKSNGQPKIVREAAQQIKRHTADARRVIVPVVMAPYLSEQAREVCKEEQVCYMDLFGNALIQFETIYIERQVAARPEPERRDLRSLFKPKAARILRVLLRNPSERWRVIDLAQVAQVSSGLVSKVSSGLRDRDWAEQTSEGLTLIDPNGLLDAWSSDYLLPPGEQMRFYSHIHSSAIEERWSALRKQRGKVALASFSAAQWLAPYVRNSAIFLYVDPDGLESVQSAFKLSSGEKGANFIVRVLEEDGALDDAIPVNNGIIVTSPVQTYLDLMHAGDRGREGAEHLRKSLLEWNDGR